MDPLTEGDVVYIVAGLGSWFLLYAMVAWRANWVTSLAGRLLLLAVAVVTQGIPALALVYPLVHPIVRLSSALELGLAAALTVYLLRTRGGPRS